MSALNIDMNAVTRLTKAGRLLEATTLLQRVLSGSRHRGRPSDISDSMGQSGGRDDPPMIDLTPPSIPGAPWASPEFTPPASHPCERIVADVRSRANVRLCTPIIQSRLTTAPVRQAAVIAPKRT